MINSHVALSIENIEKFQELKQSPMYGEYLQEILQSPIINEIIHEHIEDLDITKDIKNLKQINASDKDFSTIFIDNLKKIANRIVADTIIMKELIEISIEDVKKDLTDNFKIKYMLGLAKDNYYKKAEDILKKKPDVESLLYRGLVEYHKKNNTTNNTKDNIKSVVGESKKKSIVKNKKKTILKPTNSLSFTAKELEF